MTDKNEKRYLTFRSYLTQKYGCSVRKISIHSNLSCPNRTGQSGADGCIFCNNQAFFPYPMKPNSIREQISSQIERFKKNCSSQKFIAYFQTFTNTNAPPKELKKIYDSVRDFPEIIAISIGTRPDCIDQEILYLIQSYCSDYDVWIEYGLQTARDETLKKINRGHTYQDFLEAVKLTNLYNLFICVHVIIGLPEESLKDVLFTAGELARLPIHAVKFHPLQVIRETYLEKMYRQGKIRLLDMNTYVQWIVRFMEYLPRDIIIQRVTADAAGEWLVAPEWCRDKARVIQMIDEEFIRCGSQQGIFSTPFCSSVGN
jgi:radical SAM protein (TIGR01212 family)